MRNSTAFPSPLAGVLVAAALSLTALPAQEWYRDAANSAPPARRFHAVAHLNGETLLFGGIDERSNTVYGDLWSYDGLEWQQRTVTGPTPGPRQRFAYCVDTARSVLVLFGGLDAAGQVLGDTWEFDGSAWSAVATATAPSARTGAAMAFDSGRGVAVLFGGGDANAASDETWEFDGLTWQQSAAATPPGARQGHAMVYDPTRGVTVLFGGFDAGQSTFVEDTWTFDGASWSQIVTLTTPSTAVFPAMTFFAAHDVVVMTGALGVPSQPVRTWAFDGVDWHPGPTAPPEFGGRQAHGMAYDGSRDLIVVFGGARISFGGALPLDETWELSTPAVFERFGAGCPIGQRIPDLDPVAGARPQIGSRFELELRSPGVMASFAFGFDDTTFAGVPLPADLSVVGLPGCQLHTSIDHALLAPISNGTAIAALDLPLYPALLGLQFFAQAFVLDTAGPAAMSNAGRLTVGN